MPFRAAYKTVGGIVAYCTEKDTVLDELPLCEYKKFSPLFDEDLYGEISLETCVGKRVSAGGTGYESVEEQIKYVSACLK